MRVFILCTGRNASVTFTEACKYIRNYTSAHESLSRKLGDARFDFPDNHIEADNRLSWFTGQLHDKFGDEPLYIHFKRDRDQVARSFMNRFFKREGVIDAYCEGLKMTAPEKLSRKEKLQACYDYVDTITSNVELFLSGKSNTMTINLETIDEQFAEFWQRIGAEGDFNKALEVFKIRHNPSAKSMNLLYNLKLKAKRNWQQLQMLFD